MKHIKYYFNKHWPSLLALMICGIIVGISILFINLPTGFINKKTALKLGIEVRPKSETLLGLYYV